MNFQAPMKPDRGDGASLLVHSVFETIQGEGPYSGTPCVFIRLGGCNLACPFCDTEYTKDVARLDLSAIISMLPMTQHYNLVVITGGEPFRQNIAPLVKKLLSYFETIQIETNGTLAPPMDLPTNRVKIVCSPKTGNVNKALHGIIFAYKYVVDHKNLDWYHRPTVSLGHPKSPNLAFPHPSFGGKVYVQPMDVEDPIEYEENVKAAVECARRNGYIFQFQIHKLLGME